MFKCTSECRLNYNQLLTRENARENPHKDLDLKIVCYSSAILIENLDYNLS